MFLKCLLTLLNMVRDYRCYWEDIDQDVSQSHIMFLKMKWNSNKIDFEIT